MGYKPKYAKGQILVAFFELCSKTFANEFGEKVGYQFIDAWEHGSTVYIYETPANKEKAACEKFKASELVEWAGRRDLKIESRWKFLEEAGAMIQSLEGSCEIPDNEWEKRKQEIIGFLKKNN